MTGLTTPILLVAMAQPGAGQPSLWIQLFPFALMLGIFYVLVLLPMCRRQRKVQEFQSALRRLATYIMEDARNVGHAINTVLLVKALERIGDHARNLAEYVIYLVQGDDIRHQEAREQLNGEDPAKPA